MPHAIALSDKELAISKQQPRWRDERWHLVNRAM
jgi:hypothetical protein